MTPYPTADQILEELPHVGGRPSAAWNEVLRILNNVLPGTIALANETCVNFKGDGLRLPAIAQYFLDGEVVAPDFPCISVAADVNSEIHEYQAEDFLDFVVYVQCQHPMVRSDVDSASDLLDLVRGVLWYYQGAHADAEGRVLWNSLIFTGKSLGPQDVANRGGFALHLRINQTPGEELWLAGSETPQADPTPQEVLDVLKFCGGRQSVFCNALLDILERSIPAGLAKAREEYGLRLPNPAAYYLTHEGMAPSFPILRVGATAKTHLAGPMMYNDELEVTVDVLWSRAEVRREIDTPTDYANLIRASINHYREGCINVNEWRVWDYLTFAGISIIPSQDIKNYGAYTVRLQAVTGGNSEMWRLADP